MADLHKVVDLGAGTNAGLTDGRAINGGAATHLNAVFKNHLAGLRHFSPALRRRHEAESLRADNGIGVHHTATPETAAGVEHGIGVQLAAITHHHVVVDHHPGVNDAVGTKTASLPDADPRAHRCAGAHHSPFIDHRRRVNLRQGPAAGMQLIEGFSKGQTRIREDRKGDATLRSQINQILLVGQQQGTHAAGAQGRGEGVALLQKAELRG